MAAAPAVHKERLDSPTIIGTYSEHSEEAHLVAKDHLEALKQELRGFSQRTGEARLRFGTQDLDRHLPGNGLQAGLHELCPASPDLPDEAASTQAAAFLLGRSRGPVIWALSKRLLFAPGITEVGLDPSRILYVEAGDETSVLATAEEALRHGGLGGVVAECRRLSLKASRRLQLAAEKTGTVCLALRLRGLKQTPLGASAALTRWIVSTRPSTASSRLPRSSWHLDLVRCRGGQPRSWNVELEGGTDAQTPLCLRLVAELASPEADAATGQSRTA